MPRSHHVIIDGFNVIFGDETLRTCFQQSQEDAKGQLLKLAQCLHDEEGSQVTVVFDGQGNRLQVEHPVRGDSFTVVHSTSQLSADGVIERMLSRARHADRLIVVSDDRMIRDAALACGAEFKGVDAFLDWVQGIGRKAQKHKLTLQRANRLDNRLPL